MNVATRPMMLSGVSEQQWQIRCDLAALYRLVALWASALRMIEHGCSDYRS
jgi:hypothetical protein